MIRVKGVTTTTVMVYSSAIILFYDDLRYFGKVKFRFMNLMLVIIVEKVLRHLK